MKYYLYTFPNQSLFARITKITNLVSKWTLGKKFSPRAKHIALKYHHFRTHAKSGRVEIQYRPKNEHLADILTKPLLKEALFTLCYMLCGWGYAPNKPISN